jgi:hypothetical protein
MARLNDRDLELLKFDDRLLLSSLKEGPEENGRQSGSGFLSRFTNGFSNALGLVINGQTFFLKKARTTLYASNKTIVSQRKARTIVNTVTETRTLTTTYTESAGYNHFYISDCIPPTLYYPICKNITGKTED